MTSKHEKIYSIFVSSTNWDSNQTNFMEAINYTMGDLLTTLPARNVLLTTDTLKYYKSVFEYKREQRQKEYDTYKAVLNFFENDYNTNEYYEDLLHHYYTCKNESLERSDLEDFLKNYLSWRLIYDFSKNTDTTKFPDLAELKNIEEKKNISEEILESLIKFLKRKLRVLTNENDAKDLDNAEAFQKCYVNWGKLHTEKTGVIMIIPANY